MMSLSRCLSSPVRQVSPTLAALTGWVNSGITTSPASPAGAAWMWAASSGKATFWVVMAEHRVRALRSMVMVPVPVPVPPQVPGAVGHTSSAPDSWIVKVAVFGSARAPLAVMTAATALRATAMTAMVTSRLPIERSFPLGRTPDPAAVRSTTVPAVWFPSCRAFRPCTATSDGDAHGLGGNLEGRRRLGLWSAHLGHPAAARAGDGDGHAVAAPPHSVSDLLKQVARPRSCHDRAGLP